MKKKLTVVASVALIAVMVISGTLAYLTSTDSDVNVMTLGNVEIKQNEQQRVEDGGEFTSELENFEQGKILMPVTYPGNRTADEVTIGDYTLTLSDDEANYVDKIISVTNTGSEAAYVRTLVAVPTGGADWEPTPVSANNCWLHWNIPAEYSTYWALDTTPVLVEIDGVNYYVWEFVHKEAVAADKTTFPMVRGFYMDKKVDNDNNGYYMTYADGTVKNIEIDENVNVLAFTQAVQAAGFADAQTALDEAFGDITETNHPWVDVVFVEDATALATAMEEGKDVVLTEDIKKTPDITAPYGNKTAFVQNGGIFDGAGNVLDMSEPNNGDDYGIMTSGGTVKNVAIKNSDRAIMVMYPTENVIVENVTIKDNVMYPINTGEAGADGVQLIVNDSVFGGWISFSNIESASFTGCTFVQGTYYNDIYGRVLKPYVNTLVKDCTFGKAYNLDLSGLGEGCTVTLENCTVDGKALTADVCTVNPSDYDNCTFSIDLPSGRDLADCVVFK